MAAKDSYSPTLVSKLVISKGIVIGMLVACARIQTSDLWIKGLAFCHSVTAADSKPKYSRSATCHRI